MRGRKRGRLFTKMLAWILALVVLCTSVPLDGMRVYAEEVREDESVSYEILEGQYQEEPESEEITQVDSQIEESENVNTTENDLESDANQQGPQEKVIEDGEDIINSSADEVLSESNDTIESIEEESVVEALEDEIVPVCTADGFTIDSSGIITAYTGSDINIVIPVEARGLAADVFSGNTTIQSVDFSQNTSIQMVKDYSFQNCSNLEIVKFSGSINELGDRSFSGTKIQKVIIPAGVKKMGSAGYSVFDNCDNLTEIEFEEGMKTIPYAACYGLTSLEKVTIPSTVGTIGSVAFSGCTSLENIELPNSITTLENSCFSGCTKLNNVTLPNELETIESDVFQGCEALTKMIIPATVKKMGSAGYSVFDNCDNLIEIVFEEGMKTIPYAACEGLASLNKVTIPATVETIESVAFSGCTNLENIVLPNSITTLENSCFSFCTKLNNVTLPNKLETIEDEAFKGCDSLTKMIIPATVKKMGWAGYSVFSRCDNLTEIEFEEGMKTIPYAACYGLTSLEKVTIPSTVGTIGSVAFSGCTSLTLIELPSNISSIDETSFPKDTGLKFKVKRGSKTEQALIKAGYLTADIIYVEPVQSTTYKVKYDANAASVGGKATGTMQASSFTVGDTENTTKESMYKIPGYTFVGWNTRADGKGLSFGDGENENGVETIGKALETTFVTDTNATVTLYAQWTPSKHIVTLHKNIPNGDDSYVTVENVDVTTPIPTDGITRAGYKLKNWNTQADGRGKTYVLNAKGITENLNLYAQWSGPVSYTVTYVLDGGTNASKNIKKYTIVTSEESRTLLKPTKKGYHFVKWVDVTAGESSEAASEITKLPVDAPKNIKLQAVWQENIYKVCFHNGNTEYSTKEESVKSYTYTELLNLFEARNEFIDDSTLTEKAKIEKKNIIAFTTKTDGKGTSYVVGKNYSKLVADAYDAETGKGVIDLYAKWGTASYQIIYTSEGEMKNTGNPTTYSFNASKKVAIKAPTRVGYIFKGWSSENEYYDAEKKVILPGAIGDITLTAIWEPISYTVNISINSKDPCIYNAVWKEAKLQYTDIKYETPATDDNTFDANKIYNKKDIALTAAYEFVGWNTKANGKGVMLSTEGDIVSLEKLGKKNKTTVKIYAIWKPKTYKVTYINVDPENSSEELSNVTNKNVETYTYNQNKKVSLSNPTKYGFIFKGWYEDKNFKIPYNLIQKNTVGNITVYGKWEVK